MGAETTYETERGKQQQRKKEDTNMKPLLKTFGHAAVLSIVAFAPMLMALDTATANQGSQDSLAGVSGGMHSRSGDYKVPAGETKPMVILTKPGYFRVCAASENAATISVHLDKKTTEALPAGKCENFKAAEIDIQNPAKAGVAHGTFRRTAI